MTHTLAELRALAKRKGMLFASYSYGANGDRKEHLGVYHPNISGTGLVNGYSHHCPIRDVVFAALSALPDKAKS